MTRDEWVRMTKECLVLLRREIATGETKEALETLKAFEEHLVDPPSFKAEILWVFERWMSNAKKNTRRAPQFTFTRVDPPGPNVLKYTDEQRQNLLLLVEAIFDGHIAVNTKTGVAFPVGGNPQKRDTARVISPDQLAIRPRED